jgi:hypothetical protein
VQRLRSLMAVILTIAAITHLGQASATESFERFLGKFCAPTASSSVSRFQIERARFPLQHSVDSTDVDGRKHSEEINITRPQFQESELTPCDCGCGAASRKQIRKRGERISVELGYDCGCARSLSFRIYNDKWYLEKLETSED